MKRLTLALVSGLVLAAACAGTDGAGSGPSAAAKGEIAVEVYSGVAASVPSLAPPPVHFLVDITPVLTDELLKGSEEDRVAAARLLTLPYLQARTTLGQPEIHAFHRKGPRSEGTCADGNADATFFAADAIAALQGELARRTDAPPAYVVLFTGFQNDCAPRLCEAVAGLLEPGSWLDVVSIGTREKQPACLSQLRTTAKQPVPWITRATPAPPAFAVEALPQTPGAIAEVLVTGTSGRGAVPVPAGLRQVRIQLDPPEIVGPIRVRPGERLRVRLMDFPLSAPGERSWVVEAADATR